MSIAPTSSAGPPASRDSNFAGLQTVLRISDHARETHFFGEVPVTWPGFAAGEGAAERRVWDDAQCHQRRGLPKVTVIAIDGTLEAGPSRLTVSARPRHIGLRVPMDEIRQARPLPAGRDDVGPYLAYRTETVESHVAVLVKIYEIGCMLM